MSFNEASEDTGFFNIFPPAAVCLCTGRFVFSFSPAFLCILRTGGSVRIMGVRRQLPESPSAGSGYSLPSFTPGESLRPVLYGENVPPSKLHQSINSLSSSLSIPIFQQHFYLFLYLKGILDLIINTHECCLRSLWHHYFYSALRSAVRTVD